MGKNKRGRTSKKSKGSKEKFQYSVDDLMDKVEEYVDRFEYDLALKFCDKALKMDPSNARVIETSACVYAETGDTDKAKAYFSKAAEVNPDNGHEKYMYLGQMSAGLEAQQWYLKGIDVMKNMLNNKNSLDDQNPTVKFMNKGSVSNTDISSAYCALAEIFMTDCCFEENAENQCLEYCKQAIDCDPNNVDAYIVNANFLLSTEKTEEARDLLGKCFSLLKLKEQKSDYLSDPDNEEILEDMEEIDDIEKEQDESDEKEKNKCCPSYDSRVTLAKLLTEVKEYEKSNLLLAGLTEEDDEDIYTWYMFGLNFFLGEQLSDAVVYLKKARELCEKLQCDDEELVNHLQEMLGKCEKIDNGCDEEMEIEN